MAQSNQWHIQVNGKRSGPVPTEQVTQQMLSGSLGPFDLAWRQGMGDWAPLSTLPEFGGTPPPPLPDDAGPFRKVGTTFYLDGQEWVGRTVASPHAFYLLKGRSLQGVHIGHNIAGSLIDTAIGLSNRKQVHARTCKLVELPEMVRAELDPKGKNRSGMVVVVLKPAVQYVKAAKFNNVIRLVSEGLQIRVVTSWFGVGKVKRWLADQGWPISA